MHLSDYAAYESNAHLTEDEKNALCELLVSNVIEKEG